MVQSQVVMTREDNYDNSTSTAGGLTQSLPCIRFRLSLNIKSLNILRLVGMNRKGNRGIKSPLSVFSDKRHVIRRAKNDIIAKKSVNRLYMISD